MGSQRLNPRRRGTDTADALRWVRRLAWSLGAWNKSFRCSGSPPPSSAVPYSEVFGASHPSGSQAPLCPPAVSAIHHCCQPPPPPTLQRRCVPCALARLPLQLSELCAFKRSPGHCLTLWAETPADVPPGDGRKVPGADTARSCRDWQP